MNPKTAIHEALQSMIDAAANAAGLPLTTWLVQAAGEKLARHPAPPFHTGAGNIWIR